MKICVYGASSAKIDKSYIDAGEELGRLMVKRGHSLVFGGGDDGLMGAVSRGVHEMGGEIIGVAPEFFNVDGVLSPYCTKLIRTKTMRERKQTMEDLSDGFIMTPGGIGTFEEFFEILTLRQLMQTDKPIAVLNTDGYYDCLQEMMENAISRKFVIEACLSLYSVHDTPDGVLDFMENYVPENKNIFDYKILK